jgi:ABC-type amino acid transport substrate-binding protein
MKKPWLAFLLNFLFAGVGFVYLSQWKWAVINFLGAVTVGVFVAYYVPGQISVVSTVVAVFDGGIASTVAKSMNAKLNMQAMAP